MCFIPFTNSNVNLTLKHSNRHTKKKKKKSLTNYLGIFGPGEVRHKIDCHEMHLTHGRKQIHSTVNKSRSQDRVMESGVKISPFSQWDSKDHFSAGGTHALGLYVKVSLNNCPYSDASVCFQLVPSQGTQGLSSSDLGFVLSCVLFEGWERSLSPSWKVWLFGS